MSDNPVVIVSAARTPIGDFQGQLSPLSAAALGQHAIAGALAQASIAPAAIDEVIMGCVLSAGQGQAPARQAALGAGLLNSTPCTTINKMCGSGLKAVMMAYDMLLAGSADVICAGGIESMSNAPYLLPKARAGYRMGHAQALDHMFIDGLEDAYEKGTLMGVYAERCAQHYGFTRQQQDDFALRSLSRAQHAAESGAFSSEIVPVTVKTRKAETVISVDELPTKARPEKIPTLKPAFDKQGTVTAANASAISDGASALVLTRLKTAKQNGWPILGKIVATASAAQAPEWFTTAPVKAIEKVLARSGWSTTQVDRFEINEAFAVVTMAAMESCQLSADKVNTRGGACALGHPIGASGARILTTLLHTLKDEGLSRGLATLCIGGGEACALTVEREAS